MSLNQNGTLPQTQSRFHLPFRSLLQRRGKPLKILRQVGDRPAENSQQQPAEDLLGVKGRRAVFVRGQRVRPLGEDLLKQE